MAESLPANRLEQLAHDLNELSSAAPGKRFDKQTGIPSAFQDLHPSEVFADRMMPRVLLAGCVDDKVMIYLRPLGGDKQQLVLLKGELQGEAVLWSSK